MFSKLKKAVTLILAGAVLLTVPQVPAFAYTDAPTREVKSVKASAASGSSIAASGSAIAVTGGSIVRAHISAKQDNKSVRLTVSHTDGKTGNHITGYRIYKKTGSGKWQLYKENTKRGTFTVKDTKVKYKKSYSYRARAYYKDESGKTVSGKYSSSVHVKIGLTVSKAVISAKPVKADVKLTISHKKAGKISGYAVYKKNKSGKWVRRATLKKTGKTSYTDTNTTSRRKNTYRVRTYYKADGKTYYGAYTKSVSVKVAVSPVTKKITDKKSAVYGKTLVLYQYADGSMVEDPTKYVDEDSFQKYVMYVNKAKQYVTAYGVRDGKLYPLRAFICSPGYATPVGTHHILAQMSWHELMGPCWGQWCSKVASNGIYFHSIFSSQHNSNNTMSVRGYNNLGTTCSHGCIRLQAGSAKWIYNHCKVGTTVEITNSTGYEPFSKPVIEKLPSWHTWDPTDPTAQKYCKAHKCHKYAK